MTCKVIDFQEYKEAKEEMLAFAEVFFDDKFSLDDLDDITLTGDEDVDNLIYIPF